MGVFARLSETSEGDEAPVTMAVTLTDSIVTSMAPVWSQAPSRGYSWWLVFVAGPR